VYIYHILTFKSENLDKADDGNEKKKARTQTSTGTSLKVSESIGSALDPSVIFSTVTNAHEGMTCMHIYIYIYMHIY
jgi:hypothetical protein